MLLAKELSAKPLRLVVDEILLAQFQLNPGHCCCRIDRQTMPQEREPPIDTVIAERVKRKSQSAVSEWPEGALAACVLAGEGELLLSASTAYSLHGLIFSWRVDLEPPAPMRGILFGFTSGYFPRWFLATPRELDVDQSSLSNLPRVEQDQEEGTSNFQEWPAVVSTKLGTGAGPDTDWMKKAIAAGTAPTPSNAEVSQSTMGCAAISLLAWTRAGSAITITTKTLLWSTRPILTSVRA